MKAAEEGDRKGEWKQPVTSWQPDAQVRALMDREGWGDKATCFEVRGVKGNTLREVEAMLTQQGGLADKLCDKYLPCLVSDDPSSAARALPEMEGFPRQPLRRSSCPHRPSDSSARCPHPLLHRRSDGGPAPATTLDPLFHPFFPWTTVTDSHCDRMASTLPRSP